MSRPAAVTPPPAVTGALFAGTGTLLRLALRRDRIMAPAWVLLLGLTAVSGAGTVDSLYDGPAARADLVRSVAANSSLRAMIGPVFGDSLGALVTWRFIGFLALGAAAMSLLLVIRHTREEEESGRQELLSAARVGRRAPLAAALLTALTANTALALIITAGLAGPTGSVTGALALGLAVGATGTLFAGVAALMAQLTESARLARGLTAAVLGAAYGLRAAGDAGSADAAAGSSLLSWLSPLGWTAQVRPYTGERWWVLALIATVAVLLCALAHALTGRRDLGMSFLPTRPGPATGRIATAGGLAWRLQRGSLIGWSVAFLVTGLAFGQLADGAADLVRDSENVRQIFERMGGRAGITDAFLAAMSGILGLVAAVYVVSSVLRLHTEETGRRAEPVLAHAVSRPRWATGHLVIAFGGAALILLAAGAGLALGHGDASVLAAPLTQLPAVWTLGAVTVLLYGVLPRFALAAWPLALLTLALGWIGPALDLPSWALQLSPFGHLPKIPGAAVEWTPLVVLTALSMVLAGAGMLGLRRRDLRV
ncbi:ABC transporter permease [Streptomyces sp. NPDC057638]|uniref:ABC transporter permease n=1 Tax=Streptomyces sp. NPDC057638 TaxID=3346190 RepID=UPI0036B2C2CA